MEKNYNYTDEELCRRINTALNGKTYTSEEFWKLVYERRKEKLELKTRK